MYIDKYLQVQVAHILVMLHFLDKVIFKRIYSLF